MYVRSVLECLLVCACAYVCAPQKRDCVRACNAKKD